MELPSRFNLAEHILDRTAAAHPDRTAVVTDDRTLSYAEVVALSHRVARTLLDRDVRPEERVVVALRDGPTFVAALFGILRVGAVVVMVNPDLPAAGLAAVLRRGRVRVVITHDPDLPAEVPHRLVVDDQHPEDSPVLVDDDRPVPTADTHPDDPAIWLFSGGTTGEPKIVPQTHRSFANTTELYALRTIGYGPDDRTIAVPRLYFGYATGSNLLFPFAAGGSTVLSGDHPTPEGLFRRIAHHRPTILVTVPKMVAAMLDHPELRRADLSSLRLATSAGEALPAALYERWVAATGVELLDGLGTAEMWHIFLTNRPGEVRPGTLGRAVDGFEVRVRDEDGRDLPAGQPGRLWVRGDSRALGYWQDIRRTAEVFRGEWVVTGDLIVADPDGYIRYIGRADDTLKVGGKWVVPAEVEGCLLDHPEVSEAAVVGVPDAQGLTVPVAFVVAADRPGLADELRGWVLDRLEPHKHPRRVYVVDELPRTHLGKVDRTALRRRAAGELSAAEGPGR